MTPKTSILAIGLSLVLPLHAADRPCAKNLSEMKALPTAENGYGPQKRFGSELFRCEGMYSAATAGSENLTVVSFTFGSLSYPLNRKLTLDVGVAPGVRPPSAPVKIRALPLKEGKNYQMDAAIPANGQLVWPAGELLELNGISADQLGIYATAEMGSTLVFIPLFVRPAHVSVAPAPPLLLSIRYPYYLQRLGWKLGRMDSTGECVSSQMFSWEENRQSGEPIAIDLSNNHGDCISFRLKRTATGTAKNVTLRVALPGSG